MTRTYKLSGLIAMMLVIALAIPGLASANGKDKKNDNGWGRGKNSRQERRTSEVNEFGVRVWNDGAIQLPGGIFQKGAVTAISGTGFTFKAGNNTTYTVTTSSAKLVQLPHTVIALSGIAVNDTVSVTGTINGANIDSSVVFVTKANVKPAAAKGVVTAVSGNTVTVQTKDNKTITVNTDSNTQVVKKDGTTGTVAADVTANSKVKLFGLWDNVLHVFNAIKIKIR